eukprot:8110653-Alexandrium_andersonii.AAC.1
MHEELRAQRSLQEQSNQRHDAMFAALQKQIDELRLGPVAVSVGSSGPAPLVGSVQASPQGGMITPNASQ